MPKFAFTVIVDTDKKEWAERVIRDALRITHSTPIPYAIYVSGDPELVAD